MRHLFLAHESCAKGPALCDALAPKRTAASGAMHRGSGLMVCLGL